jgi:hypothetical protein
MKRYRRFSARHSILDFLKTHRMWVAAGMFVLATVALAVAYEANLSEATHGGPHMTCFRSNCSPQNNGDCRDGVAIQCQCPAGETLGACRARSPVTTCNGEVCADQEQCGTCTAPQPGPPPPTTYRCRTQDGSCVADPNGVWPSLSSCSNNCVAGNNVAWVDIYVARGAGASSTTPWRCRGPFSSYDCNGVTGTGGVGRAYTDPRCENGTCAGAGTYTLIGLPVDCSSNSVTIGPQGGEVRLRITCAAVPGPGPGPSHNECQANSCVSVAGAGADQCSTDANCGAGAVHYSCQANSCVSVAGAGPNGCQANSCVSVNGTGADQCTTNANCGAGAVHNACQANSCVSVAGAGPNQCTTNANCGAGATHNTCQASSCVLVAGAGPNQCSTDADCGPQHNACVGASCQLVPGGGPDSCADDSVCGICGDGICNALAGENSATCAADCTPSCAITADPGNIVLPPPKTVNLTWECENVDPASCSISPRIGPVPPIGSQTDATPLDVSTEYRITCTLPAPVGASASVTAHVYDFTGGSLRERLPGN